MRIWQIVALLVAGVLAGLIWPHQFGRFFGQITLLVLLPALLFEAAWNLEARVLLTNWRPVALLALPGVVLTALIVGAAAHLAGIPWLDALLLGSILSATDPIAVAAIFKQLNVPTALATIIQGESLLNDAMAVVLYRAMLAAVLIGLTPRAGETLFALALLGIFAGIGIGVALGWAFSWVMRDRRGLAVCIVTTVCAAYASYYVAEHFGFSGLFATLACSVSLRRFSSPFLSETMIEGVYRVWDIGAASANVVLFFLIGAAVALAGILNNPYLIGATLVGIGVSRILLAYGLLAFVRPRLTWGWMHVVRVAGVRGALSLALAISLPSRLPYRGAIIDAVFAVVLVTIAISALRIERTVTKVDF
ncbi:MAG: cation:proton antiporter [Candidatus Eremiobacteraeota bacterium]|nr:cation:proton antiporter [Candidatus Eremiobacteraeota bacterium]